MKKSVRSGPSTKTALPATSAESRDLHVFLQQVTALLEPTAAAKGYNSAGIDGFNRLYTFVQSTVGHQTHAHGLGEIIYKAVRYAAKGQPEDLVKIAAWAFLVWKHK